ncbi:MAG: histidinol-phosphate transaminase [Methanomassiliicoccaceae archaeon]|nr:histidinol-phosphate transaminase [Methanomassiliicoccaceae archaeon]MCL2143781.1 histidinol-phosphate transaminase [Methanomassiliicoccaceae archaeon]
MSRERMRSTTRNFQRYYNPDASDMIRMDTNTNVLGSNPAAAKFLASQKMNINDYPNTYSDGLRDALAELYSMERENFVVGSGSDEILDITFKTFTEWDDKVVVPVPSYTLYDYFVNMNGGIAESVDLTDDFQLSVDDMLAPKGKMIIMPSPNNPTGNSFRQKDIEEILERSRGIVIVDEAYGEYSGSSMIPKVNEFDNLIVMRTFSKAYAMAGLRIGYGVSNKNAADMMNCVKIPYSLNILSEGAAIAAVKDQEFIRRSVELVNKNRRPLSDGLKKLGFEPFPSDSNFILAKAPVDHTALTDGLKKKGILIRDFGSKRRTENCVRTTVGTEELNSLLLKSTAEVLNELRM